MLYILFRIKFICSQFSNYIVKEKQNNICTNMYIIIYFCSFENSLFLLNTEYYRGKFRYSNSWFSKIIGGMYIIHPLLNKNVLMLFVINITIIPLITAYKLYILLLYTTELYK